MDEQKKNPSSTRVNLMLALMCLVLGLTGLDNLIYPNPSDRLVRPALGLLVIVAGAVGFAVNLVVFLRQRRK